MKNVAIFGVPRSGTSWLGQLFNSSPMVAYRFQPLFSYAFKNRISLNSNTKDINFFYKDLLNTTDSFVLQEYNITGNKEVSFSKDVLSYLVWKEVRYLNLVEHFLKVSDTKVIGLVRNPFAVMNSWINAPKEFDKNWIVEDELIKADSKNLGIPHHYYGLDKWIEAYKMFISFQKKYPDKFYLQYYEKLTENTQKSLSILFEFIDLQLCDQTKEFINYSSSKNSKDPYGVFRKNINVLSWQNELLEDYKNIISKELLKHNIVYNAE